MKTLGILGGLGPQATVSFYQKIINYSAAHFKGFASEIYPPMVINNCNFAPMDYPKHPDRVNKKLLAAAQSLQKAGADFLAIPSNTPHLWYDEIANAVAIPIIHMPKEVVKLLKKEKTKKVGVLQTTFSHDLKLYQNLLEKEGIDYIANRDDAVCVNDVSIHVISGKSMANDKNSMRNSIKRLKKEGAEKVILGCTEIPILLGDLQNNFLIDTLDILLYACLREISS